MAVQGFDAIAAEKEVGRKYANMMRAAFRAQISVLDKKSGTLKKIGSRVRFKNLQLQSIAIKTVNYAFVNFYGVDKDRKEHIMHLSKKGSNVKRKTHPFKLNPKIQTLEIPNHIVEGFATELAEIRGSQIITEASKNLKLEPQYSSSYFSCPFKKSFAHLICL